MVGRALSADHEPFDVKNPNPLSVSLSHNPYDVHILTTCLAIEITLSSTYPKLSDS